MTVQAAPPDARTPVDVYKTGRLAGRMWREGEEVMFAYDEAHLAAGRPAVAWTLPLTRQITTTTRLRLPAFFAGLLPEGDTQRRELQRAFHLAEDDELGLLAIVGADTIGDVQVTPAGSGLPAEPAPIDDWSQTSLLALWRQLPGPRSSAALPGMQPKMSARSRSLHGAAVSGVIVKFALPSWDGVIDNEHLCMRAARDVGLDAADTQIVTDLDGTRALAVTRFDRTVAAGNTTVRHAQEDACQILGLRPGEKYDPDARAVIGALSQRCAAPRVAVRDLVHQLLYSYVVGNNDVHAKNLSVLQDPRSGLWRIAPVYDVVHTWPYEGDHRFVPAIRPDGPHDSVSLRWWLQLAADVGLPERALRRLVASVTAQVDPLIATLAAAEGLPAAVRRDARRVLRRRARDLTGA